MIGWITLCALVDFAVVGQPKLLPVVTSVCCGVVGSECVPRIATLTQSLHRSGVSGTVLGASVAKSRAVGPRERDDSDRAWAEGKLTCDLSGSSVLAMTVGC